MRTLGNHHSLYNRININTARTLKSNKKRLSVPKELELAKDKKWVIQQRLESTRRICSKMQTGPAA